MIATEACCGSRPVANALGAVSSIRYTRGIGTFAAIASSWTTLITCGADWASTSLAPETVSTSASPR